MSDVIYVLSFIVFLAIIIRVIMALNIERFFKKGRVWEIKAFVVILSVIISHLLASFMIKILELNLF